MATPRSAMCGRYTPSECKTANSKLVPWQTEKWIANRCTLSYPKFQNFLGGAFSQTPLQGLASHTAYYHQIFFSALQPPHKYITPALYFAWPMLFTLLLPQQKFAPEPPASKRQIESSYWSFSRQLITSKMQLSRSSRSTTNSYSRCVCVCVCVSMWVHVYIVCANTAVDCAIIPKWIMRSSEIPLCLMSLVNFWQLWDKNTCQNCEATVYWKHTFGHKSPLQLCSRQ